jgi:hypothetical protein
MVPMCVSSRRSGLSLNRSVAAPRQSVAISRCGSLRRSAETPLWFMATVCGQSWPSKLPMNLGVVSVAQTVLSAVSQVGNLRAWLYPDASLVFTPADCQSAIRQTTSLRYNVGGSWPVSRSKRNKGLSMNRSVAASRQSAAISQCGSLRRPTETPLRLMATMCGQSWPSKLPIHTTCGSEYH